MEERYIASIDLGTSKFGLCVARVTGDDVQIVYYKETPSDGIRNSLVYNPRKAMLPLQKAVKEAEEELMIKIMQVVVGLPRKDVIQQTATATIERHDPDDFISEEEVADLKSLAIETYPLEDTDNNIMYGAVAQAFSVDDDKMIQMVEDDVVGAISKNLEGTFKVFIGNKKANMAVDKIFNTMNIAIAKTYFLPDVVAKAVLTDEEKQNGVALVDIGAGVTSVCIYYGGIMRSYAAIPFGGKSITGDIRSECSISEPLAENIKKRFGACIPSRLGTLSEKVLQLRITDPIREVSVKYLSEIIDARSREIINAVLYYIQESCLQNDLRSGIVLTGGGARLTNLANLVKDMSGYEVRLGYPLHKFSTSVNNIYELSATAAVGMILAAKEDKLPDCASAAVVKEETPQEEKETMEVLVIEEDPAPGEIFTDAEMGTVEPEKKEKTSKGGRKKNVVVESSTKAKRPKSITWEIVVNKLDSLFEKTFED